MKVCTWLKKGYAVLLVSALWSRLNKKIELRFDNCPTPFDFTEAGEISIDETDRWIKVMEKINNVEE